jgi:hypothetical protein
VPWACVARLALSRSAGGISMARRVLRLGLVARRSVARELTPLLYTMRRPPGVECDEAVTIPCSAVVSMLSAGLRSAADSVPPGVAHLPRPLPPAVEAQGARGPPRGSLRGQGSGRHYLPRRRGAGRTRTAQGHRSGTRAPAGHYLPPSRRRAHEDRPGASLRDQGSRRPLPPAVEAQGARGPPRGSLWGQGSRRPLPPAVEAQGARGPPLGIPPGPGLPPAPSPAAEAQSSPGPPRAVPPGLGVPPAPSPAVEAQSARAPPRAVPPGLGVPPAIPPAVEAQGARGPPLGIPPGPGLPPAPSPAVEAQSSRGPPRAVPPGPGLPPAPSPAVEAQSSRGPPRAVPPGLGVPPAIPPGRGVPPAPSPAVERAGPPRAGTLSGPVAGGLLPRQSRPRCGRGRILRASWVGDGPCPATYSRSVRR